MGIGQRRACARPKWKTGGSLHAEATIITMSTFDLERFVSAQTDTYAMALEEVRAGKKRSHWMWFIFPQFRGIGSSAMSMHYAIGSIEEAKAFLAYPVLGARLKEITEALNASAESNAEMILGEIDAAKFRSSMTLFDSSKPNETCFRRAIDKFFAGIVDDETVRLIASAA
jgi:uncharacterized protein (DUF1810 family)